MKKQTCNVWTINGCIGCTHTARHTRHFYSIFVLIFVFIRIFLVFSLICPSIQQSRFVRHYNETSKSLSLCVPIQCKGELTFCTTNYTSDVCTKCPTGTYILDSLNSSLFYEDSYVIHCIERGPWSCPPEAKLVDPEEDSDKICECDISRGYFGEDFRLCRKGKPCLVGEELNNGGNCKQCDEGFYKSGEGFGPCLLRKNCQKVGRRLLKEGSTTKDNICGGKIEETVITTKGTFVQLSPTKISTPHIELITPPMDVVHNYQTVKNYSSSIELAASAKYSPMNGSSNADLSFIQNSLNKMKDEISGLNARIVSLLVVVSLILSVLCAAISIAVYIIIKIRKRKVRKSRKPESQEMASLVNSSEPRSEQRDGKVTIGVQPTDRNETV